MKIKPIRCWALFVKILGVGACVVMCGSLAAVEEDTVAKAMPLPKIRIVLVGASTATDAAGWGLGFAKTLKPEAVCINCAKSGRSSKSYFNEGWWQKALDEKPDYMLIQFGNNDQPGKGTDRATDPNTTYSEFMGRYVDEARAAGIKPIIVTSLVRRQFDSEGKIHSTVTPYVEAAKRVAAEKQVPVVDMHAITLALHEKLGPDASRKFNMTKPNSQEEHTDRTHLSPEGAEIIGKMLAEELKKAVPELSPYFK
jgi:pectinesterase